MYTLAHDVLYMLTVSMMITMKSTKVQTLGAFALHATTACTDDASTAGLCPLNCAIVYCPALLCML